MVIQRVAIHPAIGIMRVGNSSEGYFVGPELPGARIRAEGGFKDEDGTASHVKRQAARFRIFAFDEQDALVGEVTADDAEISWSVALANTKSEWDKFDGIAGENLPVGDRRPGAMRNRDFQGDDRKKLKITPSATTLSAPNDRKIFDDGYFFDEPVPLGEARTDEAGRLLVLGGAGHSASAKPGQRISHYANNDWWHDDVSDGPVTAKVRLPDGRELDADPAWVICGPPDFSPDTINIVTLYDVAVDTAIKAGLLDAPTTVSFHRDIRSVLERGLAASWTSKLAHEGHGQGRAFDWSVLGDPAEAARPAREAMLARIRNPHLTGKDAEAQATEKFMPALAGDSGDCVDGDPSKWLSLTTTQYDLLVRWAAGDFEAGQPVEPEGEISPYGLDRAALEACAGGAFFPGIEGGWVLRNPASYKSAFRLDPTKFAAGDITKRMAVPWQADFFECNTWWWPAQRPDYVVPEDVFRRLAQIDAALADTDLGTVGSDKVVRDEFVRERATLIERRALWTRGLPSTEQGHDGDNAMVTAWPRLGFVIASADDGAPYLIDGQQILLETDRALGADMDMAEAFYRLVNIERYSEFRDTAKIIAREMLATADYGADPVYNRFDYSVDALRERLDQIYQGYVAEIDDPHWLTKMSTRTVIENLRQKAPMNLVDGAWLHHILAAGPCDEVRARLFSIWMDEAGNGTTELNHCNVYDALLRSVDIYLPPISSRAFRDLDLVPSAWENSVFQMAVGLFPDTFLPELLGMTLYLEWEATPTMIPAVRMLEHHGIDPQFYRMHAAIDNVTAGHGALAREAVELYLDAIKHEGGEESMQRAWARIWNGYVGWATLGTFGGDLRAYLLKFEGDSEGVPSPAFAKERMIALIRAKAPYARSAHGNAQLGGKPLGSLFADPEALMDALLAEKWINPRSPRDSRLVTDLITFRGPMYKVFDTQELDVVLDWIGSLAGTPPPPPLTIAAQVHRIIERYIVRAANVGAHRTPKLPDPAGTPKPFATWCAEGDVDAVMAALAASKYIVSGDPDASKLIGDVLEGQMANILDDDEIATLRDWISQGCPARTQTDGHSLFALREDGFKLAGIENLVADTFTNRRSMIGAGAVH